MCSEIDEFSPFLRRMSGSDNPQIFPVDKKEGIISSESHPQIVPESETATAAEEREAEEREKENLEAAAADHQKEPDEEIKSEDETDKASVSHRESEDDDGFKTPTSSDHRIPAITQCPPAPKKLRPPPSKLKRKASPPGGSRSIQMDSSTEVESIFCPIAEDQDDTQQQKIKKARTDD